METSVQNIIKAITNFIKAVKTFISENSSNPFFWAGVIIMILIIFEILHKSFKKK